jgi:uncharacterized protein (TIGR03382 family)
VRYLAGVSADLGCPRWAMRRPCAVEGPQHPAAIVAPLVALFGLIWVVRRNKPGIDAHDGEEN